MNRPPLEVADLVRAAGRAFLERGRKWITWQHLKVLWAIARCRTAALGGHLDECTDRGYRPAISYNSRDRHCPKCQANARDRWLEARRQELLPTRYVHVVFTLPHELAPRALQNKKILYPLLLQTSAETLLEVEPSPLWLCPKCGGRMVVIERLTAAQLQLRSRPFWPEPLHETTIPSSLSRCPSPPAAGMRPSCPQTTCTFPNSAQSLAPTPRKLQANQSGLRSSYLEYLLPKPFSLENFASGT
jgi:ribosome modulation factor